MKLLFYILVISLNISCNGQEKSIVKEKKPSEKTALKSYQTQKHQFEFKAYEVFYNGNIVKLGTITDAVKMFGKPDIDYPDLIFYNNPINIIPDDITKVDKFGHGIIEYKGKEYSLLNSEGETVPEVLDIYIHKGGVDAKQRNKDGVLLGHVHTYRIWMSNYESTSSILTKSDSLNAKIPALNGYIKINGKLIHQSITKKELVKQLQPLPAGGQIVRMLGDPVLIYDLGDKGKEFDPNIDPQDSRVFIDFVFKTDPITKEEKGLYYINYYYSVKPIEKAKK